MVVFLVVEFKSLVVESLARRNDWLMGDHYDMNYVALPEIKSDYEILLAINIKDLN